MSKSSIECKIQRYACKLRRNITKDEYSKLYPTGLTLTNFIELSKFIKLPIKMPLTNFRLQQLRLILGMHLIIYLNILRNYYPRSANQSTQSQISKKLFKNLKKLFLWIVTQSSSFWSVSFVYPRTVRFHRRCYIKTNLQGNRDFNNHYTKWIKRTSIPLHKKCTFFF